MKRPSFQFYPADWRSNAKLRRCSPAARGVWMDVMCILHDGDEYGLVRWPLAELARAAGAALAHVRELVEKGVLKGHDRALCEPFVYTPRTGRKDGEPVTLIPTQAGPIWYSSRMVKDEYVRTIRGQSTRYGDSEDAPPKRSPKPPFGDGSSTSSSPAGNTVPDGTGGKPPANDNPTKSLFDTGVQILTSAGQTDKQARSIVGQLRKAKGDEEGMRVLVAASRATDPVSYVQAAIKHGVGAQPDKPRPQASDWNLPDFFDAPTPAKAG